MKKKRKAIFGFGGHAKEVASFINEPLTFFVDDKYSNHETKPLSSFSIDEFQIMIAIGDSKVREKISKKLSKAQFFTFIHPTAIIGKNVQIGYGSYIGPFSVITCDVNLGNHSILNRFNAVGHDVICDDFLSMMPGAIIGGNCNLGKCVFLGSHSVVREKINICNDVILGLNSGVVKNIQESGVFVGTPAIKIK